MLHTSLLATVDLRSLRPYQQMFRENVAPADVGKQRALLYGSDAIVWLPDSKPGMRKLGGRG